MPVYDTIPDLSTKKDTRADFAAEAAADAFGRSYVAPDAQTFRDRNPPEIVAPVVDAQFHRGKHRRLLSWWTAR